MPSAILVIAVHTAAVSIGVYLQFSRVQTCESVFPHRPPLKHLSHNFTALKSQFNYHKITDWTQFNPYPYFLAPEGGHPVLEGHFIEEAIQAQ